MERDVKRLLDDVRGGHRMNAEEALLLFGTKGRDVWEIASAADEVREQRAGNAVTYVRNQNINVTNLCVNACGFCGYSKKPGEEGIYFHDKAEIQRRAALATERECTEICTVSGLHPDFSARSYTDVYRWIHEAAPGIHLHASNPMEVAYAARKSKMSTVEVLGAMKEAGLNSMCGTAAEILVDDVRQVICKEKIPTKEWVRIVTEAHGLGIPSTATIMYGHCESEKDRVAHLAILRDIQDETNGFTEFVPLSFIHMNTPIYRQGKARAGATGREDHLMVAVSRLFLDNFRNIQVSWVKEGIKMAQIGLIAGANDLGGTVFEESISKGAGATNTDYLDPKEMQRIAEDIGRPLRRRTTLYKLVS
ncbi:5-amino-6-(D-ribitylamino)uracil--L-tyrosine 4-hydroxyphenyl transferase CofH [Methanoregula formicica]|uniref:5-amino-6-(D-ribitylamino)uracil--L-tyrosine 4-hydroxyphenyl transferase n=1 Tax=Methanoregula formicica (strain DSM 22288 / NBRC 105244 / SMSP) TaxID=593750 RepID=L0HDR6_METFS|nr:5-amino-6-(D-ribitylamino)uracil--L-tyrosine 4-hydroxyphenyl transferase CofH [Methanoregula formicica]AGB01219.1 radical SAM domain protein, CofH subfamily [Methanoregula formicica SMSP]